MKKVFWLIVLFNVLVLNLFADFICRIHMNKHCSNIYVDNPTDEGVIVEFYQSNELYNKVIAISKKYFPNEDISKIILVGFDSDVSLNNRGIYATTLRGTMDGRTGKMIHFSTQMLPGGVNDKNFEWVVIHELIHVYNKSDVTHTDPESIAIARRIEKEYGIYLKYGKY